MYSSFADEHWRAAITEAESLEAMNAWKFVDHGGDMNSLQTSWTFKMKCFPHGHIKKYKGPALCQR